MVRTPGAEFRWRALILGIQHELLTGDAAPYGRAYRDQSTFLQLFLISEQSDVVSDAYLEIRLGYVLAKRIGDLIFFFDSEGRSPEYIRFGTTSLAPEALQRLLPDQHSSIKEVSLINGDFGNNAYQRRSLSTQSLELVPPTLSDYAHVCSTVVGSVRPTNGCQKGETRRRYLSLTRGRLSERTTPVIGYCDFENWLIEIAAHLLNKGLTGDDSLGRFAKPYQFIGTEQPRHILFDVASEEIDSSGMLQLAAALRPDDLWLVRGGRFFGEIDERGFEATVRFDSRARRFEIESDQLDAVYINTADGRRRVFTKYLNDTQEFRILLGSSVVYTQGRFFTPNLRPWRGGGARINIENIVVPSTGLSGITSEKGDTNGWGASSVFGVLVDRNRLFRDVGWEPEILVCNDIGAPEMADFLGLSEATRTVVMIHAKKAPLGSTLSASSFHEVCSQAVRYLGFFNPSDTQTKLTEAQIAGTWNPDTSRYVRRQRLVWAPPSLSARDVSKKFASAISDPTFRREVWLVMGNGLSRAAFGRAVEKSNPKPNEREISYLLQSTWCTVASVGASLKVVCMP